MSWDEYHNLAYWADDDPDPPSNIKEVKELKRKQMSEIWKPLTIETYKSWCQAILEEASDNLNSWENIFIYDIEVRLASNRNLTQGQAEKLESIYAEKTR